MNFSDEYKPDGDDDEDDESCSSGVDENESDDPHSEEDIEEDQEKVYHMSPLPHAYICKLTCVGKGTSIIIIMVFSFLATISY